MTSFTDQHALTVIAPILAQKRSLLEKLLKDINKDVEANKLMPFKEATGVHFCRFVIIPPLEKSKINDYIPAQLAYSTNFDESLEAHLAVITGSGFINGFQAVFSCCAGFDSQLPAAEAIEKFVNDFKQPIHTFYRGHRGFSVALIQQQEALYGHIQNFIDANAATIRKLNPQQIHERLKQKFGSQKGEAIQDKLPNGKAFVRKIAFSLVVLVAVLYYFKLLFPLLLIIGILLCLVLSRLRWFEQRDPEIAEKTVLTEMKEISRLVEREDRIVQNQLSHLVVLKPFLFRRIVQRVGLWVLNQSAIHYYNKGQLGDIQTIHFARWATIDNDRRMIFFSNFDGSWESYLGDFVDCAATGLNLAWANSALFPRTSHLLWGGAQTEALFKKYTRVNQIETQVWYSAYKSLTVRNILNNYHIATGLGTEMTDEECKKWLKRF